MGQVARHPYRGTVTVFEESRRALVVELRRMGALTRPDVARAFATVPREVFVAEGYHHRSSRRISPTDEEFPRGVYRNDPLVTKLVDGVPVSSSSQPSLMAVMIEALDPAPGMRVLEIGAGTGYNAALLAALGVQVTSVDVQADVVGRASAALVRAGVRGVDVRLGDGYLGVADGQPYDRVIVTVGVAGVSPHWLAQLAPAGFVLAPVRHAGTHPVLRVWSDPDGTVRARGCVPAGFMAASGPLSADYPGAHPAYLAGRTLPEPALRYPSPDPSAAPAESLAGATVGTGRYLDLWFALGAWDRRVTIAAIDGVHGPAGCVLLDEEDQGGAGVLPDGSVVASGRHAQRYAQTAVALRDRWLRLGAPGVDRWTARLVPAGEADRPIRVPTDWALRDS